MIDWKSIPAKDWGRRILALGLVTYGAVLLILMMLESKLVYPAPGARHGNWSPSNLNFEEVNFESGDGIALHGWFVAHPDPQRTILLCHGNGENVADMAGELGFVRDRFRANVFAFDYRGYGKSDGKPHEQGILADGEAAQAWLARRTGSALDEIVIWGRSLGGAVGVHLAATHGAQALVLDRTFSSMVDTAARHFPWLPVKIMMRNRYPSADRIRRYHGPVFQVHGHRDQVIPFDLGRRLFDACPSDHKQFLENAELGHNQAWPDHFHDELDAFLSGIR